MTSGFKHCLAAGIGAAWLFVPPAYAQGAKVAAKETPSTPAAAVAAPRRVSPYVKYARAYAEAHKDATSTRVSLLSIQQAHRAAGRPTH
jgi:hypothetical protein